MATRGGSRPGAGRKRIYDGDSATISYRVPIAIKEYIATSNWDWRQCFIDMVERHRREHNK